MEINQLLEGSSNFKNVQADAARLSEKWAQSGLLEGYSNEIEKNNMAVILENQAKQIVAEQSSNNSNGASHGGGAGEQWAGVALPLVRKVFAQIAAKDFVSVQPMNLPSGLIFYLDFKYGTDDLGGRFSNGDNMYGNVSEAGTKMIEDLDVKGGLYGAGRFAYSVSASKKEALAMHHNLTTGKFQTASVDLKSDFYRFNFDQDFSSSIAALGSGSQVKAVTVLNTDLTRPDLTALRAYNLVSTNAADIQEVFPQFTNFNSATNVITFIVIESAAAAIDGNTRITLSAPTQPTENERGDFEDNPAGSISIPEINVELASEAIVAKTRKLKAQWTPEFAQDLNAYHSIDAEAELTSLLSEYISMEIDLEILGMLITDAVTTERWSASSNKVWGGTTTAAGGAWTTSAVDGGGYYNSQGQWFQTLGTKIQKVSNKIHQKTLRGGANFLVVSPTVSTILESIPGYAASDPGDKMDYAFGVQKVGQFNGRYKVYKNPYMTENTILLGYRGSQFLETGAVYAPYVPLMMTPLVYDPNTFTPRKGIMTRYAKKMLRPEFYGRIFVADLTTV
jgi:hypothetical protein